MRYNKVKSLYSTKCLKLFFIVFFLNIFIITVVILWEKHIDILYSNVDVGSATTLSASHINMYVNHAVSTELTQLHPT